MKVYIASSFKNIPAVRKAMSLLTSHGHTITYDWTRCFLPPKATTRLKEIIMGVVASQDIKGVREADAIIYLTHPLTRGAVGELPAGIVLNKYCFVVGERDIDCMPEYHPDVIVCKDIEEVLSYLQGLESLEYIQCPLKYPNIYRLRK